MKRFFILFLLIPALLSCTDRKVQEIKLSSEEDLAGLRVATVAGSVYDLDLSARDDISLQLYNATSDVLQSLLNGMADVVVHDEVVFNAQIRKENGIKIALQGEQGFPTAFMFQKKDSLLADACTAVQRRMTEDGSMQRLKDFWLSDRYAEEETYTHIPNEASGTPIRVATCAETAPLSFEIEEEWYGIEIDILRELGKELHRPLEITFYDPATSIMALRSGKADVLCGCMFITPERQEDFLFAEAYHDYHPAYFVLDPDAEVQKTGFVPWIKKSIKKNLIAENRWKYITNGLLETIKISLLAILLGSVLGVGLYAMTKSRRRWVRTFASIYNGFMAGIPDLVLLLIMFY